MQRALAAAAAIFLGSFAVTVAQGPPAPGTQATSADKPSEKAPASPNAPAAPATPAQKPFVPVAAGTLAAHPDRYYGNRVSLTAPVEQNLTQLSFSVDEDKTKSTGHDILVVAPRLNQPVELNTYVTVLGEVVKFDAAEVAKHGKDYKLDLPPDVSAKLQGHPVIVATNVINAAGVDLAMRLPPPLNAEEEAYQKMMRQVGPANTALRGAIDKTDAAATKEQTAILTKAFGQTEAFWKSRNKPEAMKIAVEARTMSESIDKAVGAAKWDDAKTSLGTLGQQCTSCHTTYRERYDDGSFRIKKQP